MRKKKEPQKPVETKGIPFVAMFCQGRDPYAQFEWTKRTIDLMEGDRIVSKQEGVEVPDFWSDNATFILADKYLQRGSHRETSLKQVVDRVTSEISKHGVEGGYFDKKTAEVFANEMKAMIVSQRFSFNSPVYFNVGVSEKPQCSACFILEVEDDLGSIAEIVPVIVHLFSKGSGCGYNLSLLREENAPLSLGGIASGPISFLLGYNAWGGIIKSGGVKRRAAMLARLDDWHPDILKFIEIKSGEERKARALVRKGYTVEEAYRTVAFQNVNVSVGVSDTLMRAAMEGREWHLKSVINGKTVQTIKADSLLDMIAHAAHFCGDPGIQFDDAMNRGNPLIRKARIASTNPCAEFCCIPHTACNLGSLNLAEFYRDGQFLEEEFKQAVRVAIVAQDIIVGMSGYPTAEIDRNSNDYRPLGLGFTNLGGLFVGMGIPYDSEQARSIASVLSAAMTAEAYKTSVEIAKEIGPFAGFEYNRKAMIGVLKSHKNRINALADAHGGAFEAVSEAWERVCQDAAKHGVRNCQVTLVPPAGTISNILDCTTSGIEPILFSVTKRRLDQGGELFLPSFEVERGLEVLGYNENERTAITEYIRLYGSLTGAPIIKQQHVAVFDPVYPMKVGDRRLSAMAQVRMMAAVQPFISGSISKTVGLAEGAPVSEVKEVIIQAWKMGLKAVSFYRNNSKMSQPLVNAVLEREKREEEVSGPPRRRMPEEVKAHIHRGVIAPHTPWETKLYITPGEWEDGTLGEAFVTIAKEGTAMRGLVDALMTAVSIGLQYGVPLPVYCEKFIGTKFEPHGRTASEKIRFTSSIVDYIFKYLGLRYLDMHFNNNEPVKGDAEETSLDDVPNLDLSKKAPKKPTTFNTFDFCECGGMLYMSGVCKRCSNPECKRNMHGSCGG